MTNALTKISEARAALELAKTIKEVKTIRDQSVVIKGYLKQQSESLETQNLAGELHLRAERKLGELIPQQFPNGVRKDRKKKLSHHAIGKNESLVESGITPSQSSRWQQIAKIPDEQFEQFIEETKADGDAELTSAAALRLAKTGNILVSKFTGDDENYTPPEVIKLVKDVLGEIDLDPASNEVAQKVVGARKWYSKENDGLKQPWSGAVFLNPPYSHPGIEQFIEKLTVEILAERVTQAILLTNDNTDTGWYHLALTTCAAFCLLRGRIRFYQADMATRTAPTNGQTFFYYGDYAPTFRNVFGASGIICKIYE